MLYTVPTVSRASNRSKWISPTLAYLLASVIGGLFIGAVIGSLGYLPATWIEEWSIAVLVIALVVFGLADLGVILLPRVHRNAQVPEHWRRHLRPEVNLGLYGLMLGTGVLTRVSYASFYAVIVLAGISGNVVTAMVLLGAFGAARAIPQVILAPVLRDIDQAVALAHKLMRYQRAVGQVGGVLLLLVGLLWGSNALVQFVR